MNKKILQLAIPNIISNITIPLLGMVDLAITGHLESSAYMGAIAIGSMVFNIIYWTFSFLRMGVTGLTAQAYGAKNNTEIINKKSWISSGNCRFIVFNYTANSN